MITAQQSIGAMKFVQRCIAILVFVLAGVAAQAQTQQDLQRIASYAQQFQTLYLQAYDLLDEAAIAGEQISLALDGYAELDDALLKAEEVLAEAEQEFQRIKNQASSVMVPEIEDEKFREHFHSLSEFVPELLGPVDVHFSSIMVAAREMKAVKL